MALEEWGLKAKLSAEADKASIEKAKSEFQEIAEGFNSTFLNKFKKSATDIGVSLGNVLNKAVDGFISYFKAAWSEIGNMVQYSLMSNENTRNLAFNYGLSSAQAYGFEQAKSLLGIQSDEDLYYMNSNQREKFQEVMIKYAEKYNELYDEGFFDEYLNFQIEWNEFKQDFLLDFCKIIMDNKALIMSGMHALLDILQIVTEILHGLGFGKSAQSDVDAATKVAQILNYNTNTKGNTSFNIKLDNTFNNVSTKDQVALQNVGEITYGQIVEALKVYND